MSNTIRQLEEGILLSSFRGKIDLDSVNEFVTNVEPYLDGASSVLHFIVDANNEERWSLSARREFTKIFDSKSYGKVGILNAERVTRIVATFLMVATRRKDSVRFFDNESDALAWLKE
ncbi:MAG: hypothetical protein ACI9EW_001655 [Cellvibrionaceae bacterium]